MTDRPAGCSAHKHPTYDAFLRCRFGDSQADRILDALAQRSLPNPDQHHGRNTMTDTIAKLAAKKLDAETGLSDADAHTLYKTPGAKRVAIVELQAFETTDDIDDKHQVRLRVTHLELMPDGRLADLARDMSAKAYDIRQPDGLPIDVTAETADELADRGAATLEHVGAPS